MHYNRVRELYDYNPTTGKLIHTGANKHPKCKAGVVIEGSKGSHGLSIGFDKSHYKYHRVVFMWLHGWLPDLIDHIDRDPTNNRPDNLRPSDKKANALNSDRSERRLGYSYRKDRNKWRAYEWVDGKQKHLGNFDTKEEAMEASAHYRL